MYMTFGCSRSPVTVAVPNSSLSVCVRALLCWAGRRWLPAGLSPFPWRPCRILARGSPASDRAVALAGFADFAAAGARSATAAEHRTRALGAAAGGDCGVQPQPSPHTRMRQTQVALIAVVHAGSFLADVGRRADALAQFHHPAGDLFVLAGDLDVAFKLIERLLRLRQVQIVEHAQVQVRGSVIRFSGYRTLIGGFGLRKFAEFAQRRCRVRCPQPRCWG